MKETGVSQEELLGVINHLVSSSQLLLDDETRTEDAIESYDGVVEWARQVFKSANYSTCPSCGSWLLTSTEFKEDGTTDHVGRQPCECGNGCRFVIATEADEVTRYKCCSCS